MPTGPLTIQDRFDFAAQISQVVVVHKGTEMKHIRVVTLAVQTIQNRNETASKAGKNNVRITPNLYIVPPQARKVFHENQVDNAFPGIFQHF